MLFNFHPRHVKITRYSYFNDANDTKRRTLRFAIRLEEMKRKWRLNIKSTHVFARDAEWRSFFDDSSLDHHADHDRIPRVEYVLKYKLYRSSLKSLRFQTSPTTNRWIIGKFCSLIALFRQKANAPAAESLACTGTQQCACSRLACVASVLPCSWWICRTSDK